LRSERGIHDDDDDDDDDDDKGKSKSKVVPLLLTEHYAMKAYWRNGGIATHS
jgi:hypothetical protein